MHTTHKALLYIRLIYHSLTQREDVFSCQEQGYSVQQRQKVNRNFFRTQKPFEEQHFGYLQMCIALSIVASVS